MVDGPDKITDVRASSVDDIEAFAAFERFSRFFCEVFSEPGLLDGADCRQSHAEYLRQYYAHTFGPRIDPLSPRHLKWYRRLVPLLSLPRGSSILDYGGGYGMDTIFLASLGFEMVFYEITPPHIEIARWFTDRFRSGCGPLSISFVLAGEEPAPRGLDAVLLVEVAHHIEPAQRAFDTAAEILRPGGSLFLLEPNFFCPAVQAYLFKQRGFRTVVTVKNKDTGEEYQWGNEHIRSIPTWTRLAASAGFSLKGAEFVVPWFFRGPTPQPSRLRRSLERLPLIRDLLASNVTLEYMRL